MVEEWCYLKELTREVIHRLSIEEAQGSHGFRVDEQPIVHQEQDLF